MIGSTISQRHSAHRILVLFSFFVSTPCTKMTPNCAQQFNTHHAILKPTKSEIRTKTQKLAETNFYNLSFYTIIRLKYYFHSLNRIHYNQRQVSKKLHLEPSVLKFFKSLAYYFMNFLSRY